MTLADAGRGMPITSDTIGDIESGDIATPSIPVMRAFAKLYNVSFDRLRGLLPGNAMPLENIAAQGGPKSKSFEVFKDSDGRYRWVMVSSSAYVDRDNEIVSTKALTNAVAEHDATGERGPLRWWHVNGLDLGDTDFGMVHGRMLVESGTFYDEGIGGAIAKKTKQLSASIGFKHPKNEPQNGIFNNISIFERSILPRDKASNLFASLSVKENGMSNSEKIREFIERVGAEKAAEYLGEIDQTDKGAVSAGFRVKDSADLSAMNADQLLEYSLLMKEHEEEGAAAAAVEAEKAAHNDNGRPAFLRRREEDDDEKKPNSGNSELLARLNKMMGILESQSAAGIARQKRGRCRGRAARCARRASTGTRRRTAACRRAGIPG
jgi:hypothetical protein